MDVGDPTRRTDGYYDALAELDPEELYETAPCGYLSMDASGTILKANRTFHEWTGYGPELYDGRRFQRLLPVGDRIFYETHFAPSLAMQGQVREIAVEIVCATGDRLPVLLNAAAKPSTDGRPSIVRVAVFDARERRSYEQQLVEARQRAEAESDRARALAETLQRTLLPPALPTVDGLDLGATYRPAGDGSEVGGDFYDVFETGGRHWNVVLGDVCGKGAAAATLTALARYTVRAAAIRLQKPSEVLGMLHDALEQSGTGGFCTTLFGRVTATPTGARLTIAAGGHHLPLRVTADRSIGTVGRSGSLLGILGPPRLHDVTIDLAPGDAVVLYTDGVIEARAGDEFFGEHRLRDVLVAAADRPAQDLADAVAAAAVDFQHGVTRDDIAVLVLAVPPDGR
jgi:sigma-B regulation protein RsbU (phosphoserine phosphatase)